MKKSLSDKRFDIKPTFDLNDVFDSEESLLKPNLLKLQGEDFNIALEACEIIDNPFETNK